MLQDLFAAVPGVHLYDCMSCLCRTLHVSAAGWGRLSCSRMTNDAVHAHSGEAIVSAPDLQACDEARACHGYAATHRVDALATASSCSI